jgi:hypothetical protein
MGVIKKILLFYYAFFIFFIEKHSINAYTHIHAYTHPYERGFTMHIWAKKSFKWLFTL